MMSLARVLQYAGTSAVSYLRTREVASLAREKTGKGSMNPTDVNLPLNVTQIVPAGGGPVSSCLLRQCQPLLDRALREGGATHTLADIERLCAEGRLQQWDGPHSVIITEVLEAPQRKTLLFFLAAGKLAELRAMLPPILEWGKLQGCQAASFIGRFGWQRSFVKRFGFREQAIMMEAEL